jgi:uncharacterized protein (TIGR03437 family)
VAGNGASGFYGDGGPATSAQLHSPNGVAVDRDGNLFISDYINGRVREVSPDGMITSVAGSGNSCVISCLSGDGGSATDAQLDPWAVAVDSAGSLFVAETRNHRVRKVSSTGVITTVAGNGTQGFSGDGGAATAAQLDSPSAVTVGTNGDLFISDYMTGRVRKVSQTGIITTVAGGGTLVGAAGDGKPGTDARLQPGTIAADSAGNLFIVEFVGGSSHIRKVTPDGIITTVAGNASTALLSLDGVTDWSPGPARDAAGNLFFLSVAPGDDNCDDYCALSQVRRLSPDGITTTIAGTDTEGYSGDGGLATGAQLNGSSDVAVDRAGNIYVASPADEGVGAIRILRSIERPVWISAVVDAASQKATPVCPGKLVVIYGSGLGPTQPVNQTGQLTTDLAGTTVLFNGMPAQILYSAATQVAAIAPYTLTGANAQITVSYRGDVSEVFSVPVAPSSPGLFTANQTGSGQASALNSDGTLNSAANPIKIGDSITLYGTGEGLFSIPDPPFLTPCDAFLHPILPVSVSIGGIQAPVQCAGRRSDEAAMRVVVQIPNAARPGGYVPVVLTVGDATTTPSAVWIAVSAK